jgi:peptide chain release factor 2
VELERETLAEGFWDDQRRAARISAELHRTQARLDTYERLSSEAGELDTMLEMAAEDAEWRAELERALAGLDRDLRKLQEEALFTGEYDSGPAVVSVHAGAGGTDSQDWAEMLLRMYLRWAETRGLKAQLLEATPGEEAGLKSATFTLTGENAYGIMQAEKGVHRLVRLSPFDSAHRRHTSFAQVEVSPLVDDDVPVEIDESDLRIDTYRSQGAGGQHVNKTDSAVRITHIPTGIVVQCQNERSQLQNKAQAMRILTSRLIEREREERERSLAAERGEAQDISFGSQIRSYVLHPYTMVNDHRTNLKIGNAQGVLDGDLDELVHAELLRRAAAN